MKKAFTSAIVILVGALILAACGGASSPSTSIRVTMTDFAFSPNSFTVPASQQISIELNNNGAVTHSFLIMKSSDPISGHFTDADKANVYWEQASVPPGESVKATFLAPSEPGQYQIVCGVAGHFEAGMVAKLNVVAQP